MRIIEKYEEEILSTEIVDGVTHREIKRTPVFKDVKFEQISKRGDFIIGLVTEKYKRKPAGYYGVFTDKGSDILVYACRPEKEHEEVIKIVETMDYNKIQDNYYDFLESMGYQS